jgi:Tfp pilus assembly protein FimV
MIKDKPAVLIVTELEQENKALRKEIDKLKNNGTTTQTSKPESKTDASEKPLEDESVKQRLMEIETALTEARKQLQEKEAQLEAVEDSMPVGESSGISFTAILIALLLGLGIGGALMYIYFDNRISQRFAGMKV